MTTKGNCITRKMEQLRIILLVIFFLITFISLCGGFFVVFIARKHKLLKKSIWMLLVLLTISDTATSLVTVPTFIAACFNPNVLSVRWVCNLNAASTRFFACVSIYAMTTISIYKCIIIHRPFRSLDTQSRSSHAIFVTATLLLSTLLSVCPLLGYGEYNYIAGSLWCCYRTPSVEKMKENTSMMILIQTLGFLLPATIITGASVITFIGSVRPNILGNECEGCPLWRCTYKMRPW